MAFSKQTNSESLSLFQSELVAYNSKTGVVTQKQINKQVEKYLKKQFGLYFKYLRHSRLQDNSFYLRSALWDDPYGLADHQLYHIGERRTQGYDTLFYAATSAAGSIASAFGYYFLYRMSKDAQTSFKAIWGSTQGIGDMIQNNITDVLIALSLFTAWYAGKISATWAMLGLGGLFLYNTKLKEKVVQAFQQLMPAQSTIRHTQGTGQITTFAQSIIGILVAVVLGTGCTNFDFNHMLTSIKSLGSALLTVKTFELVLVAVIQNLPDIVRYILAYRFPSIGLYVAITSDDKFKQFIKETVELRAMDPIDMFYNSHFMAVYLKNYNYMKNEFIDDTNVVNGNVEIISDILDWYDKTYEQAGILGLLPMKRKMPYVIWLSGDPGVGKSTLVERMARQILIKFFDEETVNKHFDKLVYSFNTSLKYMDGYNNQPIFVLNDYLQFAQENEEQWLIRFVDTVDCPLEVSSVDNVSSGIKGEVRFTSRVIIVTSNTTYLNSSVNVTNLTAFNRRRDMVIDMTFKPDSAVNFEHFDYSWANIKQLPNVLSMNQRNHVVKYENVEDLLNTVVNNLSLFTRRCDFIGGSRQKQTLMDRARLIASQNSFADSLLKQAWDKIKSLLGYKVLGVSLGVVLPLLLTGSAAYMLYKAWVPALISKITQSVSGDVTTKKLQKSMIPLKRITLGGYTKNLQDVAMTISKNMVKITTIIHVPGKDGAMDAGMRQQMWGWSCGGSLIITPKHLWKRGNNTIRDGDQIIIERAGIEHRMFYSPECLIMSDDRDIACYNVLNNMLPFKDQTALVVDQSAYINANGEPCCIITPQADSKLVSLIENEAFITDAPYTDPLGQRYDGTQVWQYNQKFNQGDCGSIMILTRGFFGGAVAGMHVAGDSFSGNSEVITSEFINQCKNQFSKTTQGFCSNAEFDDDEYFDAESELEGNFYFLGSAKNAPFQTTKSEIVKGPFFEVLQNHITEPSVLSPSDARLEIPCSPILKSVAKYGTSVKPFNKQLLDTAYHIVREMYSPIRMYTLRALSHEDAINSRRTPNLEKIDLRTSAGYPWVQKGKKKTDLISVDGDGNMTILPELQNVLNTCENLLNKKTMFAYTLTTTLKDERVSLEKVRIGKTRTFMNFPVEYTVLMRRYFDDFIDKETKHAMEIGTTVGVNIYSSQWDRLYQDLVKFNYSLDGDFKAFDGTIRPEFFGLYAKLVNDFYDDEFTNHRSLLVSGCCFAPIFVLNKVYVKLQGNPSGSRITTSFNSFVNRMYVIMSLLDSLPEHLRSQELILSNMKIYAHGDDHLIGFNQVLRDHWDGLKLRDFMLRHGIDYTSSVKDQPLVPTRYLHDCFYLKSHFVFNVETHRWQAGLSKEVIQEMVSWQRDSDLKSTEMILNTALRYAYFWGREYFQEIHDKLDSVVRKKRFNMRLLDYESLNTEYNYSGQLVFDYR